MKIPSNVRERMKGPRGTELSMTFHPLYTPWGPSPGGMDRKWQRASYYVFKEDIVNSL